MLYFAALVIITRLQMDAHLAMKIVKLAMDLILIIAIHANKLLSHCTMNINVFHLARIVLIKFLKNIHERAKLVMILIVRFVQMVVIHPVLNA